MNKTIVIAGGAAVASLAVGATGGYLYAKTKLTKEMDLRLENEIAETKKYFSVLLAEAKAGKPETVTEVITSDPSPAEILDVIDEEEVEEPTKEQILRDRNGPRALVNYQGFAKPDLSQVVENNIFSSTATPKKKLPPRDESGKFLPVPGNTLDESDMPEETPYIITAEVFLANSPDHHQENVKYFVHDKTVLDTANESVDIELIGEVNLTLIPTEPGGDGRRYICVRNEVLMVDYEVELTEERVAVYMGLGDVDEDDVDDLTNQL
jgi:hypothetical protein